MDFGERRIGMDTWRERSEMMEDSVHIRAAGGVLHNIAIIKLELR